ncbi:MAG TPA: DUF927 domain-containing protein [Bryobacteraceae bacterium]|nr:DUF927 domain-containing protein [Bryobacteraceae bacterium]
MPVTPQSNDPSSVDAAVDLAIRLLTRGTSKACYLFTTGDWQKAGFEDPTQADLVLCVRIAIGGRNPEVIDKVYRASKLFLLDPTRWDGDEGRYRKEITQAAITKAEELIKQACPPPGKKHKQKKQEQASGDNAAAGPVQIYSFGDGKTYQRGGEDGSGLILAHFAAKIVETVVVDDGAEQKLHFRMHVELPSGELKTFQLSAEEFDRMNWVLPKLGHEGITSNERNTSATLKHAILSLSKDARTRTVYGHTGWRDIDGDLVFLHQGGAVGGTDIETDLRDEALDRYDLSRGRGDLKDAARHSVSLLSVADPAVTYSLFGAIFRAPLCHFLPCTVMLHFEGDSGSLKSSVVAAALAHYGLFRTKTDLPARWEHTENILEKTSFYAKDVVLAIDDLYPAKGYAREKIEGAFARVLGAVGDSMGRRRMTNDLRTKREYHPRGVVISTGEYTPDLATSREARLLRIPVDKAISKELLADFQDEQGLSSLPVALVEYLNYIRSDPSAIGRHVNERFAALRKKLNSSEQALPHLRMAENLAHILLGVEFGMEFMVRAGVLTESQAQEKCDEGLTVLTDLIRGHASALVEHRPVTLFFNTLRQGLDAGTCYIVEKESGAMVIGGNPNNSATAMIGWYERKAGGGGSLYLIPDASFNFVSKQLRASGGFPVTKSALTQALDHDGLLDVNPSARRENRRTKSVVCCGGTRSVLALPWDTVLEGLMETEYQVDAATYR